MKHLQEIHMKNNILESFDFVESLTNLHVLDLSHNLLIRSADLSHHCHLLELNLSYNRLTMIPFVRGVCMFNISRNMIASLVLASGKETTLKIKKERVLDLDSSQDGEALGVAQQSVNESRLSVMGNTLTAFNISDNLLKNIDDIYLLHNLQELNAAHNDIMLLNRKLAKLSKLRVLNLAQNRIQKLPKNLDKLVALRALYLQDNDIDTLPSCLVQCKIWPAQGGHCNLTGNPLSLIPAYYRPVDKLYRFLKDISHDSQQSFIRNRVMVVGDSGVGKTTLVRKLTNTFRLVKDGIFKSIDSTVGIERTEIQLQKVIDSKERLISLDFWDFGGEGQYRTTHAFFSSSSAQYVVAFNVLYPSVRSLCNWFNLIQTTAPGAVVYLVGTHFKKASSKEIKAAEDTVKQALSEWKPAFSPKIKIVGLRNLAFWAVSNSFSRTYGTAELCDKIAEYAASKVKRIPRSYLHLMSQVVEKKKAGVNLISWKNFSKLTEPFQFSARKLKRATKFLHEYGFVFHFPEEIYGQKKWVIIHPEWLMKLFASVIGYRKQKEHHGAFVSEKQLRKIWVDENFDNKHHFKLMVGVLESFRMMILWKTEPARQFLIPSLLAQNPPDENWSSATDPDLFEEMAKSAKTNHFRVYGLPYTIPGLFAGLIVNLRKRIPGEMTCWKNTLIARSTNAEARLSLEPTLKSLNVTRGIHLYVKACSVEACIDIVSIIHWEIASLLAFSYECQLWESVQVHSWVYYEGLWIKRAEILSVFNESEEDNWEFCGVSGTLQMLLPEMYTLPSPALSNNVYKKEVSEEQYLQKTAYGKVYKAVWNETGEHVFLKKVNINQNKKWVSRPRTSFLVDKFYSEVKFLSQLQHRNIVKFQSYYSYPPIIVEEYIPGGPLSSLLSDPEKKSKMSWPLLIRIAHDLALAVQYLHNQAPQIVHGNIDTSNILIVDLDVNADQVVKLTEVSLLGNHSWWVDTSAYVSIIRELVDVFVETIESGKSTSAVDYAKTLLDNTESESEDSSIMNSVVNREKATQNQILQGALGAELVYDTVSNLNFRKVFKANLTTETDFVPHLRSHMPSAVVVPKIFQRILQFTGRKKLPDFDQICSMFTTYLNPEKTTELIKMKMGNFAQQLSNPSLEDSPPRRRRRPAGKTSEFDGGDSDCSSE
uniref:non-specific serine/threonine protein kinase n=1 Tax=Vannella robusta TaxID=1487602 RepID=A0A7S4HIC2_9EUKA